MSEWITDRPPTEEDAGPAGLVWTTYNGKTSPWSYDGVEEGTPWMPITPPEPYVKPKRYTVKWLADSQQWAIMDKHYVATRLPKLDTECDAHREAAEEIAAIYERTLP